MYLEDLLEATNAIVTGQTYYFRSLFPSTVSVMVLLKEKQKQKQKTTAYTTSKFLSITVKLMSSIATLPLLY